MFRIFIALILLSAVFTEGLAQNEFGLNPPFMKWRQIKTPTGKIIYPAGLDSLAFRTAGIMNYERAFNKSLVGNKQTKKIPVILQNRSTLPAGFAITTPWRNEFSIIPPYNMFLGPVSWTDALTLHEYRHSQQFFMGYGGLNIPYRVLMGNTGWLFNTLLVQPLWFREGDAVTAETVLSNGGRGRLPSFHMEYRAMRLNGYHYKYEKGHYFSYKNFVPNPYHTGYYMVTKARRDYGNELWFNVLNDTYRKKGFFYPFSRSLHKYTGMGTRAFYNATVEELDSLWKITDASLQITPSEQISDPETKKYTSYRFPHYLPDGKVLSLKSGFDVIPTYYTLSKEKEKKLFNPGIYTEDHVTTVVENNKMVWAESGFHERWTMRDYSVVKIYDFNTGKTKKLSHRSRYFSPAPSPDGSMVVVSETNEFDKHQLILLDSKKGKQIRRIPNPENLFFTQLRWVNNTSLVAVSIGKKGIGNAIVKIETATGKVTPLTAYDQIPFSRPFPAGPYVFFSAGFNGINNIHAVDTTSEILYQVTNVRFGAFEPSVSPDQSKLLYSEYTADGYRIKEIQLNKEQWKIISVPPISDIRFHDPLVKEEGKNLSDSVFSQTYPVKKYHALFSRPFNFYGWFPIPSPPTYGVELYTQNLMSTLKGTVGITYNTNERTPATSVKLSYAAFYPIIELSYQYGLRSNHIVVRDSTAYRSFKQPWRENSVSVGMRLPFNLTQGTHRTSLDLGAYYEFYEASALDSTNTRLELTNNQFTAYRAEFGLSRLKVKAWQQVKTRWGQVLYSEYRKAIDGSAERFVVRSEFYFPGMFRPHSFNIAVRYKKESVIETYRFKDDFVMSRGYRPLPFSDHYVGSVNYELPLFYPEIAAGPVAFFQRVRGNVFFDYSRGTTTTLTQDMHTAGAEVILDIRLLRLFQMSAVFRYNVLLNSYVGQTAPFQFVISMFEISN